MKTKNNYKILFFIFCGTSMLKLSLNELKLVAKLRGNKGYKNFSKERLLRALSEEGNGKNLDNARIKKIREDFNKLIDRCLKTKIKKFKETFTK